MTREKLIRLYIRNEQKTAQFSIEQRAMAFADRFEVLVEEEMDAQDIGVVDREEFRPDVAAAPLPTQTSSPIAMESMIVLDGNAPSRPIIPIRRIQEQPNLVKKYRTIQRLSEEIGQLTPEFLNIVTEGRTAALTLRRNIIQNNALDAVKLVYEPDGMEHPRASTINTDLSVSDGKMNLDITVSDTFFCFERDLEIPARMEKIERDARNAYRPRPGTITPIVKSENYLRLTGQTPHEDTDFGGIDRGGIAG